MIIASKEQLEKAALHYGILPFFRNKIEGFSVEEMAAPGKLFGITSGDDGCWEWKGPVIQERTTAYGKFFNRKAGFVAMRLFPDFLNYRRAIYPVGFRSREEGLLNLVKQREGMTSTELKKEFISPASQKTTRPDDIGYFFTREKPDKKNIETDLQRLQMAGQLLIADFEYKYTSQGNRYGWGVALYSTPEIWFERDFIKTERTPMESFYYIVEEVSKTLPGVDSKLIEKLII